jgi:2-polyprenyl-3-methyl-5-hydroxy-6-metoxy-1,4-benzoquinol methylase
MSSNVYQFFNKTDNYLHRTFGVRLRAEIVQEFLGPIDNARILDAGCGDGGVSLQFLKNNEITFCDLSENMLKEVESQVPTALRSRATLINSTIENFKSQNKYDYIFCIGVLAHVPSIEQCLAHLSTLLAKNGVLVIQFSDYDHWLTRLSVRLARHNYRVNSIRRHELQTLTTMLGYKIHKTIQHTFMLPGMGKLPDELLYKIQRITLKSPGFQHIGTEHIWMLRRSE